MMKQKIEIEVDVPEGFEAIAFRRPLEGEWYEFQCRAHQAAYDFRHDSHIILRKVEPVKESRWVNVYKPPTHGCLGAWYVTSTREKADDIASGERLNVVRIDYENGVPVHVTLEPTP
jgi:hypothetical protein